MVVRFKLNHDDYLFLNFSEKKKMKLTERRKTTIYKKKNEFNKVVRNYQKYKKCIVPFPLG
jgi:hypothetical protein